MQNLWLIALVFFLVLLILPFLIKLHFSYDIFNNLGVVSLYIFFIKIFAFKITYKDKQIILFTQKDKKDIPIQISDKKLRFLEQLTKQLQQKIIVKNIEVYSRIGIQDAFGSAMLCGLFNVLVSSVLGFIKNTKKSANIKLSSEPTYNGKSFTFSVFARCIITIFDILYAAFISIIIIKRSEKYERI